MGAASVVKDLMRMGVLASITQVPPWAPFRHVFLFRGGQRPKDSNIVQVATLTPFFIRFTQSIDAETAEKIALGYDAQVTRGGEGGDDVAEAGALGERHGMIIPGRESSRSLTRDP